MCVYCQVGGSKHSQRRLLGYDCSTPCTHWCGNVPLSWPLPNRMAPVHGWHAKSNAAARPWSNHTRRQSRLTHAAPALQDSLLKVNPADIFDPTTEIEQNAGQVDEDANFCGVQGVPDRGPFAPHARACTSTFRRQRP
jgi:hypothetical protein